jgi:ATP-dependent Zn protease
LWLVIISGALVFVWYLQKNQTTPPKELAINEAITRVNNKDFKEASIKQSSVEFVDMNGNRFVTSIGSDATRKLLVDKMDEFNKANEGTSSVIK